MDRIFIIILCHCEEPFFGDEAISDSMRSNDMLLTAPPDNQLLSRLENRPGWV
jgi:hypothetical protein